MPRKHFSYSSSLPVSAQTAFDWHARPGALARLIPPWERVSRLRPPSGLRDGAEAELRLGVFRRRWVGRHFNVEPGRAFSDRQVQGPFREWVHEHRFLPAGDDSCQLIDSIDYRLPLEPLSDIAAGYVHSRLKRAFRYRHAITSRDLLLHRDLCPARTLRICVAGASGLVGSTLVPFLEAGGHTVFRLVRRTPQPGTREIAWDPEQGAIDTSQMNGFDAVLHLGGESVLGRWNSRKRSRIRTSRVETTALLAHTLAAVERPPEVFLCASAVGFYGDTGTAIRSESSPPGSGFLADVATEWELATEPAKRSGIRVVNLRIGMVLTPRGGALRAMLPAFSAGLGGPVGSGRQLVSWISIDDLIGGMYYALFRPDISGPLNLTAPEVLTNAEFARKLGAALGRPAILPLPAAVVRGIFGEMGQALLLQSIGAAPEGLLGAGYPFFAPDLPSALAYLLGREKMTGERPPGSPRPA